jgi:hypothetical protein
MTDPTQIILGGLALMSLGYCLAGPDRTAGPRGGEARAGWFGVFPDIPGYRRSFLTPQVGPGPSRYRQTARYEWTGGAVKVLDVTLARGPAPRGDPADAGPAPAQRIDVGGRPAWLSIPKPASRPGAGSHRLVVRLGPEGALILEAKGPGPWERLPDLARRFDLQRMEAALGAPPRVDFRRTLATFRALRRGCSASDVEAWAGPADRATQGATRVLTYDLDDGSRVLLAILGPEGLRTARHVRGPEDDPGDVIELGPNVNDDQREDSP